MIKKIISSLMAIFISIVSCNSILIEILEGDFSYIINTTKKTALIRKIYIPANTKKDIVIPKFVEFHNINYLVTEIKEDAIKDVIQQIKSFMARDEFVNNERNFKALSWLIIFDRPFATVSESQ